MSAAVIAAGLLVVAGAILIRRRRAGASRREVETIDVGGPAVFNIVALGAQETGKTVLLASMFHRLSTESTRGGFRLETGLEQSVHLNELYATLCDPDRSWPPGTLVGETRSFTFDCIGTADGSEQSVFRFNYLDYAGELVSGGHSSAALRNERGEQQQDLEARIEAAHAVFGIIDGRRMIEYLRGCSRGQVYLDSDVIPMVNAMRKARCPVHFLVTKWDLFDDVGASDGWEDNDRLDAVARALMAQAHIRNLIEQRRDEKRIVRLIPTSSIGRHFADANAEGHMVKRRDGRLCPVNVEAPLSVVVPDLFEQVQAAMSEAVTATISAQAQSLTRLSLEESLSAFAKILAGPLGAGLRAAGAVAIGPNAFSDRVADTFLTWMSKPFDDRMDQVRRATGDAHRHLAQLRLAQSAVLKELTENTAVLRRQLPAGDLTGRSAW